MWNLIALLIVFALMAGGTYEVYQNYGTGQAQQTAQNLSQEVATTAANISTAYAGNPDFTQIATASTSVVPATWTSTATGAFSLPSGGSITFAPASVNGSTAKNGYTMTFATLSQTECTGLAGFVTQKTASITINGTTVTNTAFGGTASTPPWGSNLVYLCTSGNANAMTFAMAG